VKICFRVKDVPETNPPPVESLINASTGRLDRSGRKPQPGATRHAIEAAMQLKSAGAIDVARYVAVTMGPEARCARSTKAVSLGADRPCTDRRRSPAPTSTTGYLSPRSRMRGSVLWSCSGPSPRRRDATRSAGGRANPSGCRRSPR